LRRLPQRPGGAHVQTAGRDRRRHEGEVRDPDGAVKRKKPGLAARLPEFVWWRRLELGEVDLHGADAVDVAQDLNGDVFLQLVADAAGDMDDALLRGDAEVAAVERAVHRQL